MSEYDDLLILAKECLSIVESSTMKDKEIVMLIESAIQDLEIVGIEVESNIKDQKDNLIINTIMIYVKAHFGDTDVNKREMYLKRYKSNKRALMETDEYSKKEESNV